MIKPVKSDLGKSFVAVENENVLDHSQTVLALLEYVVSILNVCLTHVHCLVLLVRGGADEPAAAFHRLKREQIEPRDSLFEEKTPHAFVAFHPL